jgi:alkylation response protein AidB-like acyl-CoA dehydrogenase
MNRRHRAAHLSPAPEEQETHHGYSAEFDVERYYRDAPLMVVGEGTNDIQRNVIIRQLIDRYPA